MKFLIMLHYICTGPFYGGISWIGVLEFVPRKNILRICFVSPVLICRTHRSICGESFHFFCILLLRLDVLRCNLEIEWFVLRFQFSALSAPPLGSLGPSKLWGIWLWHNIIISLLFSEVLLFSWCFFWQYLIVLSINRLCPGLWRVLRLFRFIVLESM